VEAHFVSQQVVYHGTGDENITSHFNRQRAGEFWLGKISQIFTAYTTRTYDDFPRQAEILDLETDAIDEPMVFQQVMHLTFCAH
jgi:hypothetical protein